MIRMSIVFNVIIVLALITVGAYAVKANKKIAYVNTSEIFSAFKMTKEIDAEVKKIEGKKQAVLDSMAEVLKKIQAGIIKSDENNFNFLKKEFLTKRNQFGEEISKLKEAGIEKVWKQINQYTME